MKILGLDALSEAENIHGPNHSKKYNGGRARLNIRTTYSFQCIGNSLIHRLSIASHSIDERYFVVNLVHSLVVVAHVVLVVVVTIVRVVYVTNAMDICHSELNIITIKSLKHNQ